MTYKGQNIIHRSISSFIFFIVILLFLLSYMFFRSPWYWCDDGIDYSSSNNVVALTGDSDRIKYISKIMSRHSNIKLFISGIGHTTILSDIKQLKSFEERIYIDNKAINTLENAYSIKDYIEANNINDIIVLTSDYHVPRTSFLMWLVLEDKVKVRYSCVSTKLSFRLWINQYFKWVSGFIYYPYKVLLENDKESLYERDKQI
ncbi:MAG: YdcF family protein [Alphaproteobacteria bacterium]|nr:YdcF family protein [Alphaproteobacteria bacterium]MBL0717844.1 YdcF family protein [Alphaproteobacteria bacterium]